MAAIKRHFKTGDYIFRENDPPQSLFIIKQGTVGIRKKKGTAFIEIARLNANEILGELSFFDRNLRSASALALTEVEALEVPFESLDNVYERVPNYIKAIMTAVSNRLRKANNTIRRLQNEAISEEVAAIPILPPDVDLAGGMILDLEKLLDDGSDDS